MVIGRCGLMTGSWLLVDSGGSLVIEDWLLAAG